MTKAHLPAAEPYENGARKWHRRLRGRRAGGQPRHDARLSQSSGKNRSQVAVGRLLFAVLMVEMHDKKESIFAKTGVAAQERLSDFGFI